MQNDTASIADTDYQCELLVQHCKGSLADQSKRAGRKCRRHRHSTNCPQQLSVLSAHVSPKIIFAATRGIESAIASVVMLQAREFATTTAAAIAGAKLVCKYEGALAMSFLGQLKLAQLSVKNRVVGATASCCCTVCLSCHCHSSGSITKATAADTRKQRADAHLLSGLLSKQPFNK